MSTSTRRGATPETKYLTKHVDPIMTVLLMELITKVLDL
jgi:hypothetical protein